MEKRAGIAAKAIEKLVDEGGYANPEVKHLLDEARKKFADGERTIDINAALDKRPTASRACGPCLSHCGATRKGTPAPSTSGKASAQKSAKTSKFSSSSPSKSSHSGCNSASLCWQHGNSGARIQGR